MAATTTGTSGNDTLIGGSGADTLDGGAGSDFLNAGSGDDILRYVLSQNTSSTCKDIYIGGSGKDTLVMVLTDAEWAQDSVRSQLLTYLNHLKAVTNAKTGEVSSSTNSDFLFTFGTSTLSVQMVEKLQVVVNGRNVLDSSDSTASAPILTVTAASGNEDSLIDLSGKISATLTDTDGSESISGIRITGIPAGATLINSAGNLAVASDGSITLSEAQLVGLKIMPPLNSDMDFNLSVIAYSTELNGNVTAASLTKTLAVTVNAVADAPTLSVQAASGNEDTAIDIGSKITAALTDTDGSETLMITIAGIPAGATLTNTAGDLPPVVGGSVNLSPAQLAGLAITPATNSDGDFNLSISATSTETNGGDAANTGPMTLAVTVNAVADAPTLSVEAAAGNEDTAIDIGSKIVASLTDTDGSETLMITIAGIPAGATLTNTAGDLPPVVGGSVNLTPAQLAGLAITPATNSDGDFDLSVSATSTETNGGDAATTGPITLAVTVNAVADAPSLAVQAASGNEDTAIAIGNKITAALTDTDGSEHLTITIAGIPAGATLSNTAGDTLTISGGSVNLTPAQLAGLAITPAANSDGDFNLSVSATSTETNGGDAATTGPMTLAVTVNAVADAPTLSVQAASGNEDTAIDIGSKIVASLTDTDGSEHLTITVAGIPTGATLSNTAGDTLTISGGSVNLTPAQLAGLAITPAANSDGDFNLSVSATSTEINGGDAATTGPMTLSVTVNAVADAPTLSVEAAAGNEDTAIAIGNKITAALTDTDGSEHLMITIAGIPAGATLSNTAGDTLTISGGSVNLTPAQLAGLAITPATNSDGDFNLSVSATSTEINGGDAATTGPMTLSVTVNAVADAPSLAVQAASGNEDTAIVIGNKITAALTDTDGSEHLTITIAGIPAGATLTNTAGDTLTISGGSVNLTPAQLTGLAITPAANSDGDFDLSISATSTETNGGDAATTGPMALAVTVNAVADAPSLAVQAASGNEDTAIAIGNKITAALTDTDGSEHLMITIAGIPAGATLSNTAGDTLTISGGSVNLTPAQLTGLAITPAANSDGDFDLSISATSTETNGGDAATTGPMTLSVTVNAVADAPTLSVEAAAGNEDTAIAIGNKIVASLNDSDGSETLMITIAGIPAGATLSNTAGDTLTISGGSVNLTPAQLAGLAITPATNSDGDFDLAISATSTETNGGDAATTGPMTLSVTVNAVADAPTLSVSAAAGDANTSIALGSHISAALVDTDGSESLAITIAGIPSGATLANTAGDTLTINGGSITLNATQLAGLAIRPPLNSDADFNLSVSATSTEGNGGSPATATTGPQTLAVTVNDIIVGAQGLTLNGGSGNTAFNVGINDGKVAIIDTGGGNDSLTVDTTASTSFSTFNFERVDDNLVLTLVSSSGSTTVTVQNHFGSSVGAVETVTFSGGGTAYGYNLGSAGYNLQKDLGGSGQADVIASSSLGQSLTGIGGNDLLFGNDGNDTADGGLGNDLLVGGAGNDRLIGGDGNDVLVGGTGSDTFVFNIAPNGATNVDAIKDFNANGEDFIELASGVFSGLSGTGTLNAGDFTTVSGTGATANFGGNTNVNIIFDTSTGNLYYDSNGGDATGRTLIASLTVPAGTVDATDFKVV